MLKRFIFISFLLPLLMFSGCTEYEIEPQILPQYIKKIYAFDFMDKNTYDLTVQKFANESPNGIKAIIKTELPLQHINELFLKRLTEEIKNYFIEDKRIEITDENNADAILFGGLTKYILTPTQYDENFIAKEYKLLVWVNITLFDRMQKKILWTEKRMEEYIMYKTEQTNINLPSTEIEAQNVLAKILAEKLVKRTIDGWFAASGVSKYK